ncbi:Enhancer of translation termination 1 [Debaryomyces fabryi]|uniref:Enhancer of translation termination 1 n=1 Tax=Debaryomyces fabryi TaxID=58627 RepID=A0A0V1PW16_9ASCO|nr:Enhancer of translation termination 1 [Debaryomyces fabryi]KSA00461.1 Enhancer of translation termination 1 [Debaryomyces fabryi]CUM46528.1 unnamed protein product [Debaryomyces fabryi]
MAPKRHLGLGKAAKSKKQKKEDSSEVETPEQQSNEITVELNEEADANDEVSQLRALWRTHAKSDKDNELVVNGIIHECDRLLRNSNLAKNNESEDTSKASTDESPKELPADFHSIYALALADLALFHTTDINKVREFFDAALERVGLGLQSHDGSIELLFTKSRILINQIPLQYISQLTVESKVQGGVPKLDEKLDHALEIYEEAENQARTLKQYELFNDDNLEILQALDDLLEIVDNFGKDTLEGDESDKEEDDEEEEVQLSKKHPLYGIRNTDKYNEWWRDHIIQFLQNVDKQLEKLGISYKQDYETENALLPLRREICKRIGQSYLQEAEIPSTVFTTLKYDEGFADVDQLEGLTREQSQKISQDLFKIALDYLQMAEDKEEPESWVNVAESMISLGNLYELDSEEQENYYTEAEKILAKANNATNGKYEDILENLQT